MADPTHLEKLGEGVEAWNKWIRENPKVRHPALQGADLRKRNLRGAELTGADLSTANLDRAYLSFAFLTDADLSETTLTGADLSGAFLHGANLRGANLTGASLRGAYLSEADLTSADLTGADLLEATMARTNLQQALLRSCRIYGISAWDLRLDGAIQSDLVITPSDQPTITVDRLDIAQFIYLLLKNENVRHVIDTITSKVVLILGRFVEERKAVLDALREELRKRDYTPVLFDFDGPSSRDLTETVSTLAHMARFVIADLTAAKSIPQELQRIVPNLPSVPVQPILLASQREYALFASVKRYPWVLATHVYESQQRLIAEVAEKVISPPEAKAKELRAIHG